MNLNLTMKRFAYRRAMVGYMLILSLAWVLPASGQDKSEYYTVMFPDRFDYDWTNFYETTDALTAQTRAAIPHKLNLIYGEDTKHKLDLYFPSKDPQLAPVFLFIHGGGFREGDRAHYGFVAGPFSQRGYITAVTSYRLTAKGFHYPIQPQDIHQALAWLYKNIADYGGDPNRIYVGGHSAGGILAAEVCVRGGWLAEKGLPKDLIKGCVPISTSIVVGDPEAALGGGVYATRKLEDNAYVDDPVLRQKADPLLNIDMAPPRALFVVGSEESIFHDSARAFVTKLTEMGSNSEVLILQDHNHADTVLALADKNSTLFTAVMRVFEK